LASVVFQFKHSYYSLRLYPFHLKMHLQVERIYIYLMKFIDEIGMILPVKFSLYNS